MKRRIFDINFPAAEDAAPGVPAGTEARRGPMAAAITENAGALRERQLAESAIRDENDQLAHELVRLKKLGLIVDLIPLDAIRTTKLIRDRAMGRDPELDELKESIKSVGLSNPIRVEPGEGGFELVQGFRRLAAYRELLEDTGDARYATIPAGLVAKGESLELLYRRMVDENLVRRDVSFAEMALLARAYLGDQQSGATDIDQAIATLFASAGRQKKIYIRNFVSLLDRVGDHLLHPHALPRALGLALLKRMDQEPATAAMLRQILAARPGRDEAEEVALLKTFAEQVARDDPAETKALRGLANPGAKTSLRVVRGRDVARCAATDGRVELRMERDFSAIDRHRLEQAVVAFLDALDG